MNRLEEQVYGVLASRQDGIGKMPVDILHPCRHLQVVGERGEPLAAAVQPGRQGRLVGLWRHGHGVIGGHGEVDPAGEGVFGVVFEVRVRTLTQRQTFKWWFSFK